MIRKKLAIILTIALSVSLVTGCGSKKKKTSDKTSSKETSSTKKAGTSSDDEASDDEQVETETVLNIDDEGDSDDENTFSTTSPANLKSTDVNTYNVGDVWTVDGQWAMVVTSVKETDYRESGSNPAAVYEVEYTYTNIGYVDSEGVSSGLNISLNENITDSKGVAGYSYVNDVSFLSSNTPVGATCNAKACVGVDNAGAFSILVDMYDGNGNEVGALFNIEPTAKAVEDPVATITSKSPEAATAISSFQLQGDYNIGETWTIDGQWKLTVTGVRKATEKSPFETTEPAAAYLVSYTYENLGYVDSDGIMDGLYFIMDDVIVDSTGSLGRPYVISVDKEPLETPVGETCEAEVGIALDNPGSFVLYVSDYDGNGTKQSASFKIDVE